MEVFSEEGVSQWNNSKDIVQFLLEQGSLENIQ